MALPTPEELRKLLVAKAFESDAFIVSKGEKTQWMKDAEQERADQAAKARASGGLPPMPPAASPPPLAAPVAVLEKLASAVKVFIAGDVAMNAATRVAFKSHFSATPLGPQCDGVWDAALPGDVAFAELRRLGMHRGGVVHGADSFCRLVKSQVFGPLMPNGALADDFVCLVSLLLLDPGLSGGVLEWNEMDCTITLDRKPFEYGLHDGNIRIAIGSTYSVKALGGRSYVRFVPSQAAVHQAVEKLAHERPYHEAREYLIGRRGKWDGVPYIAQLPGLIGAVQEEKGTKEDIEHLQKVNKLAAIQLMRTIVGTVARTIEPGCQMDTMLVLKSKQGTKKSTLFRTLAPANKFSDSHLDFENKDSMMAMRANSMFECSELAGMKKKQIEVVKAFVTCRSDDFRLPYAKAMSKNPRHCVLVGTTNEETPLNDSTGTRRFWVIAVEDSKKIDIKAIEAMKDQLWSEAVAIYDAAAACPDCIARADGETRCPSHRWWLTPAEDEIREEVNAQFTVNDPFEDLLASWIENGGDKQGLQVSGLKNTDVFKVYEVLEHFGFQPLQAHDSGVQRRMARALKRMGFTSTRHRTGGVLWKWVPTPDPAKPVQPPLKLVPEDATATTPSDAAAQ